MLYTERIQMRDKESHSPWLGHFFISFEQSSEKVYLGRSRVWHPPTDVYETDSHVMVKIEVAGVSEDDFRSEVTLPCDVDESGVRADYDRGFLYILLPKLQREHKVPVVVVNGR